MIYPQLIHNIIFRVFIYMCVCIIQYLVYYIYMIYINCGQVVVYPMADDDLTLRTRYLQINNETRKIYYCTIYMWFEWR